MAQKKGLGKGLDALFADNVTADDNNILTLKITEIEPNKDQPRRFFDETALAELADSIKLHGVIQPLLVRPTPTGIYQLIAGERRWRASRMAGLSEVPVLIKEMSDQQAMELALIENLQREDLNPIEEALGYQKLMSDFSLTQDEVASKVGKSRPAITNAIRLLGLPNEVVKMVQNALLTPGHARALIGVSSAQKVIEIANLAVKDGLSVRDVERLAKQDKLNNKTKFIPPQTLFGRNTYYSEFELALSKGLGRDVKVIENKDKKRIEIEFFDEDDLKKLSSIFKIID